MTKKLTAVMTLVLAGIFASLWISPARTSPAPSPAPVVSVTSATTDGSTLTIGGSGFGSGPILENIEYLKPTIEAGTIGDGTGSSPGSGGLVKTSWGTLRAGDGTDPTLYAYPHYSSDRSHTGTKSLRHTYYGGQYDSAQKYSFPSQAHDVYISYWVYFDGHIPSPNVGQWKIVYLFSESGVWRPLNYDYAYKSILRWPRGGGGPQYCYNAIGGQWDDPVGNTHYWPESGLGGLYIDDDGAESIPMNNGPTDSNPGWIRIEFIVVESDLDTANGTLQIHHHYPNHGIRKFRDDVGNTITISADSLEQGGYRSVVWINYWGNDTPAIEPKVYEDEHYICRGDGARSRVEIGDANTWAGCTQRQIQVPSAWSSTSITATYSAGGISGDKWVYVVDADGNVNANGYLVGSSNAGTRSRVRR